MHVFSGLALGLALWLSPWYNICPIFLDGRQKQSQKIRVCIGSVFTMNPTRASSVTWREPDEEPESDSDRDTRTMHYASKKGAGRQIMEPQTPGRHRGVAWGGALRRMSDVGLTHSRQDEARLESIPGRYVPIGYARYISPTIDPSAYKYYYMAGWRVAVPRTTSEAHVKQLLLRIFHYGPQSAGYVRIGDTLVPAMLDPGNRAALAELA